MITFILLLAASSLGLVAARYAAQVEPAIGEAAFKGRQLLLDNLTPKQNQQYGHFGYFDVVGSKSGKRYRICHGTSRNVYELLDDNQLGTCFYFVPSGSLVAGDCLLAQKIMLENCEDEALRIAERF